MRDPRSIAHSLLAMRWGPDSVEAAAEWVAAYAQSRLAAEARAADLGLVPESVFIEDIAIDPRGWTERLTRRLDLEPRCDLYDGASLTILNRCVAEPDGTEIAALNRRLGGWVGHFGYAFDHIGHRTAPHLSAVGGDAASKQACPNRPTQTVPAGENAPPSESAATTAGAAEESCGAAPGADMRDP